MPNSSRTDAAQLIVGQSDWLPMMMPITGLGAGLRGGIRDFASRDARTRPGRDSEAADYRRGRPGRKRYSVALPPDRFGGILHAELSRAAPFEQDGMKVGKADRTGRTVKIVGSSKTAKANKA